jgi:hypothetical protein
MVLNAENSVPIFVFAQLVVAGMPCARPLVAAGPPVADSIRGFLFFSDNFFKG